MSMLLPGASAPGLNADEKRLWTVRDLADYLGVPVNTIYKWRSMGEGPPAYKVGRYIRFDRREVDEWLEKRRPR
ncbi:helix-turn-helix domain-containing protein [Parafrankia discariae]|uniref:helix-turn-helix domain-containing protein n=1 Tax=Parafrankia discariae TaxID=365528 RepID=UPI0003A2E7E4|nr:helix-turn-helix domain-containing protein [Parafrankia discariae]